MGNCKDQGNLYHAIGAWPGSGISIRDVAGIHFDEPPHHVSPDRQIGYRESDDIGRGGFWFDAKTSLAKRLGAQIEAAF